MADPPVDPILLNPPDEPLLLLKMPPARLDPDLGQGPDLDPLPFDRDHIPSRDRPNHESHAMDTIEVQPEQEAEVRVAMEGDPTESEATVGVPAIQRDDHRAPRLWWKN